MDIIDNKTKIILKNIKNFNIKEIFECGQIFRYFLEDDGSYTLTAHSKVVNFKNVDDCIVIDHTNLEDFNNIWVNYLDINTDYEKIISELEIDDVMKTAISFGRGIRILNQDKYEIMISFMISANNRIPMIRKVIENLSVAFGKYICKYRGRDYFAFPTIEELANADLEDIKNCKAGFRSERIREAAIRLRDNADEVDLLHSIDEIPYEKGLEFLKTYKGIGDKIANCILLFSGKQVAAFPIDVWIRRIMQTLYPLSDKSDKEIQKFAKEKFGDLAGYAQQYLFYYARETNIKLK